LKHANRIKTVTPSWIVDCVKEKKLLAEANYAPCKAETKTETETTSSLLTPDDNDRTVTTPLPASNPQDTSPSVSTPIATSSKMPITLPSTLMSPVSPVVTAAAENKLSTNTQSISSLAVPVAHAKSTKDEDIPKDTGKKEVGKEIIVDVLSGGVRVIENNNEILEHDKENKDVSKEKDQEKTTEEQGWEIHLCYSLSQLH